jgi:GT2 family glycosyltransferase
MRREVFDRLEGFDDRYFVAYADWDLIMTARMEDLRTVQHNRSTVRHIGLSNANPKKQQMWSKDRSVFRSTWGVERLI